MRTKQFIIDLVMGMAPTFFILVLPLWLADVFLAPPYDAAAAALVVVIGWQVVRRRYRPNARLFTWRIERGRLHLGGPRLSR
jgi:hypothetical protein